MHEVKEFFELNSFARFEFLVHIFVQMIDKTALAEELKNNVPPLRVNLIEFHGSVKYCFDLKKISNNTRNDEGAYSSTGLCELT